MVEDFFAKIQKVNGKTIIELENRINSEVTVSKGKVV